jgi:signal transduction histidine kinase
VVRSPRTARDLIRRVAAAPRIWEAGDRLIRPAPSPTTAESQHVEHVLSVGRVALVLASLVAITFDPASPGPYTTAATAALLIYAGWSAGLLWFLGRRLAYSTKVPYVAHAIDFAAAAALTLLTDGSASAFYLFFFFMLIAAAYRWGLRETMATALGAICLLAAQGLWLRTEGLATQFELHRLLMRTTYLLIAGALIGWLSEREQQRLTEVGIISDILGHIHGERGFRPALMHVARELLTLLDGQQLLIAVHDTSTGAAWLWTANRGDALSLEELSSCDTYLFAAPGEAWQEPQRRDDGRTSIVLGRDGTWLGGHHTSVPESFWARHPATTVAAVDVAFAHQWKGRVLLLGANALGLADVRFLRELVCDVAPPLFALYLLRRLRSRIVSSERARVGRELHDGLVQSLAGLQMEVAALRRRAATHPLSDADLARLETILRDECVAARELMHRIRPVEVSPSQLPEYLAMLVDRFGRETAVDARFSTDVEHVDLPTRTCRELARTLQEALVNVRKHAQARHVLVHFTADSGHWRLTVDNDGRPFDFTGRHTLSELDATRRGPVVIKERVREMGGELVIDSIPGHGVRLDILLPRRTGAARRKTA